MWGEGGSQVGLGMHAICGDSPERLHLARPSFPVLLARFHGYQCWTVLEDAEEHAPGWVGTDPELASCGLCRFTGCEAHSTPTRGKISLFFFAEKRRGFTWAWARFQAQG